MMLLNRLNNSAVLSLALVVLARNFDQLSQY